MPCGYDDSVEKCEMKQVIDSNYLYKKFNLVRYNSEFFQGIQYPRITKFIQNIHSAEQII